MITFTASENEDIYPYVCTYPGHGFVMYGTLYVTDTPGELPPLAEDPNIPESAREDMADTGSLHPYTMEMPQIHRLFMPDASPAAIAVGMENDISNCWDAGYCYLRYAWYGGYVDPTEQWTDKAHELADMEGTIFYRNKNGFPLRIAEREMEVSPDFEGYELIENYPRFIYTLGQITVHELVKPLENGTGFTINYQLRNVKEPVWYTGASEVSAEVTASDGRWQGEYLRLSPDEASNFTITVKK
ncbi:MAG: hypothetical protein R3281_05610 [Balneolaceae bacterium]|nr:hypothetical protein [Balneolaceae bacterium]